MKLYPIIGIEAHVQLNTKTKLFCSCLNEYTPDQPNKNICVFCTGQPGALPLLNKEAVKKAIKLGLALGGNIPNKTRWDRKNYFYPDSPSGYQISQYDNPIIEGGSVEFYVENENGKDYTKFNVQLTRAHLESDAGKLLHVGDKTLVDFNRCGGPLVEIVTEPVIYSSSQAIGYINELQLLVRTIGISDADMEKGQMRFDCNLSLATEEEMNAGKLPGYKVEVKNINSGRALGRAIEFEIKRQTALLEKGERPAQETRGWKDDQNKSVSQRSKEDAMDYRYFPEPDLRILTISQEDKDGLRDLPQLPNAKREKYLEDGLTLQMANTFVTKPEIGEIFNETVLLAQNHGNSGQLIKPIASIITGNLISISVKKDQAIKDLLTPVEILELAIYFEARKINNQGLLRAVEIKAENKNKSVDEVLVENNLLQTTDDTALLPIVENVVNTNQPQVQEYKSGKVVVIGFLVGQCMKQSKGQGNPQRFKELLEEKLV